MAAVGELLGLGDLTATGGVTDGLVALGVGVARVAGELDGGATGVAGDELPAELGEGAAGDLTGDGGVGDGTVVVDGDDAGTVVLMDGTKPGHLPHVICSTLNDQLSITEMCNYLRVFRHVPDSTQEVVLVLDR